LEKAAGRGPAAAICGAKRRICRTPGLRRRRTIEEKTMKSMKFGVAVILAMLLAACAAGVNFVKPADDKLVFGVTTMNQVVASMGEPSAKGQKISNGENLEVINYVYAKVGDEAVFKGVTPARGIGFLFHNGVLVGKEFTSSFKSDSSYFDPEKVKSIKQGMKGVDVVALLGRPGGEYRYPAVSIKDGRALVYMFTQTRGFKSQQNILIVEIDANDVVQKSEFSQIGQL
jgi:outer membrane protein assembly factor BamE (lipoprotein component of BamABCDE complex)